MSSKELLKRILTDGTVQPSLDPNGRKGCMVCDTFTINQLTEEVSRNCKIEMNDEVAQYVLSDQKRIFVHATAGSGKTTTTAFRTEKDIHIRNMNPNRICVLSYNKASVTDLNSKFEKMHNIFNMTLRRYGAFKSKEDRPSIRTLDSLTYNILEQFKAKFGFSKVTIISDSQAYKLMKSSIEKVIKIQPDTEMIKNFISVHELSNNTLKSIKELEWFSGLKNCRTSIENATDILNHYRNSLKIWEQFHYSDTCRLIVEKCEVDEVFRNEVASMYDCVIIDEAQDVSEGVFKFLKILISKEDTICRIIGDDDQSIYGFRGAMSNGCRKFQEEIPGITVYPLSVNRRCSSEIIEYSKIVLKNISNREPLEIKAMNKSGILPEIIEYTDRRDVLEDIIKEIKTKQIDVNDMTIGYRKHISSFFLVNRLLEENIPFRVKDEYMPGTDKLSLDIVKILDVLKNPRDLREVIEVLPKISSVEKKKADLKLATTILKKQQELTQADLFQDDNYLKYLDRSIDFEEVDFFYELPDKYFKVNSRCSDLSEEFIEIKRLSRKIRTGSNLSEVIDDVLLVYKKYYWDYVKKMQNYPDEMEELIFNSFRVEMPYIDFAEKRKEQQERMASYQEKGVGILLSAFHSLKGLEFKHVYLIDLENGRFPSIQVDEKTSDIEIDKLVNDELRLLYVAVTRAKTHLKMYWSSTNPSEFKFINDEYNKDVLGLTKEDLSLKLDVIKEAEPSLMSIEFEEDELDSAIIDEKLDLNLDLEGDLFSTFCLSKEEEQSEKISEEDTQKEDEDNKSLEIDLKVDLLEESLNLNDSQDDILNLNLDFEGDILSTITLDLGSLDETPAEDSEILKEIKSNAMKEPSVKQEIITSKVEVFECEEEGDYNSMGKPWHHDSEFKNIKAGEELKAVLDLIATRIRL